MSIVRERCIRRITWALLLASLELGCSPPPTAADLPGEYVAHYPFGIDRIILRADGTFRQEIIRGGQEGTAVATGQWEYEPRRARRNEPAIAGRIDLGRVYLHGCMTFADSSGMRANYREVSSFCALPLERENLIGPRLQLFADEEHAYIKQYDSGKVP